MVILFSNHQPHKTHLTFKGKDRRHLPIDQGAFGGDELLALLRVVVEEARVNLGLVVLETNVADENVRIVDGRRHVWVPRAVVHHQTFDEARVGIELVSHVHNLNHVQIRSAPVRVRLQTQHRVHHRLRQMVRDLLVELGAECRARLHTYILYY